MRILVGSTSGLSFHLPAFPAIKAKSRGCRQPEVPAVSPEIPEDTAGSESWS